MECKERQELVRSHGSDCIDIFGTMDLYNNADNSLSIPCLYLSVYSLAALILRFLLLLCPSFDPPRLNGGKGGYANVEQPDERETLFGTDAIQPAEVSQRARSAGGHKA